MKVYEVFVFLLLASLASGGQQSGTALLRKMGYPADAKLLILHADDLGMSHSVNVASFEALEKEWVSSASVMVPCPWFNEVVKFAESHPGLDLGLHLTLTSEWKSYRWGPVSHSNVATLLDEQGYFHEESTGMSKEASAAQVETEIQAQVDKARSAGLQFTHLDNHMGGLAQNASLMGVYVRAGRRARVPISVSMEESKAYSADFKGSEYLPVLTYIGPAPGNDRVEGFRKTLKSLAPGVYITIVHLGHDDPELGAIMLDRDNGAASRQSDLHLVGNPEFQRLLKENHIKLIGWREVARAVDFPSN
ncbi:MAG TPA: polysaccharide deacetylase family protein [Dongiaceae bacterium]|nr:polysaccharide deacetylase family protein [Dongiaceae bacterium]